MTTGESIGLGFATAVAAYVAGTVVAAVYVEWRFLENGWIGLWVALAGLGGFLLGLGIARFSHLAFGHAFAASAGILLALVAACLACGALCIDSPPTIGGERLILEMELEWPGSLPFDIRRLRAKQALTTSWQTGYVLLYAIRQDPGGRRIIPLEIKLESSRAGQKFNVFLGEGIDLVLQPALAGNPTLRDEEWTEWTKAGFSEGAALGFRQRRRVLRASVQNAYIKTGIDARAKQRSDAFHALSSRDPLLRWLALFDSPYVVEDDSLWNPALAVIRTKMAEYPAILRSGDRSAVGLALETLSWNRESIPPSLIPDIVASGQTVLELVRFAKSNALPFIPDTVSEVQAGRLFSLWDTLAADPLHRPAVIAARFALLTAIETEVKKPTSKDLHWLDEEARKSIRQLQVEIEQQDD